MTWLASSNSKKASVGVSGVVSWQKLAAANISMILCTPQISEGCPMQSIKLFEYDLYGSAGEWRGSCGITETPNELVGR